MSEKYSPLLFFLLLFCCSGCLAERVFCPIDPPNDLPFLVVLVDAPGLDYSDTARLLQSITKHPRDRKKDSSVGHAWIYVEGVIEGERVKIECGHSGERGVDEPKYFAALMDAVSKSAPNPVAVFWEDRWDGFCEWGNGGHWPTCAARYPLTQKQWEAIYAFLKSGQYLFAQYNLIDHHCCCFVGEVAEKANIDIRTKRMVGISPYLSASHGVIPLWSDPIYGEIPLETPDTLEEKLRSDITEGRAKEALGWYHANIPRRPSFAQFWETISLFSERYERYRHCRELRLPNRP